MNINEINEKLQVVFSGRMNTIEQNSDGQYSLKKGITDFNLSQELVFLLMALGPHIGAGVSFLRETGRSFAGKAFIDGNPDTSANSIVASTIEELEIFVRGAVFHVGSGSLYQKYGNHNNEPRFGIVMTLINSLEDVDGIYIDCYESQFSARSFYLFKGKSSLSFARKQTSINGIKVFGKGDTFQTIFEKAWNAQKEIFSIYCKGQSDIERIRNERDQEISDRAKKMYEDIKVLDASLASE